MATKQDLDWSFGLLNSAGKYLTAEVFGSKIVCASSVMKKKEIFFLEKAGAADSESVFIRSHLGKYLTVNGDGQFLANAESPGEEEAFVIEAQPTGEWALRSEKYGWYAGGSGENLTAFTKEISVDRLWTVRLAMHPMITLKNQKRNTYVHLDDGKTSLTTDEEIPWGDDAVISICFWDTEKGGRYGIQASDGSYLSSTGALKADADDSCQFVLEFHGGLVSFKADNGKFVTSLGSSGLCKATKTTVSADERYQMENSYPQVVLTSNNGKKLSIKQGVEVAASVGAGDKVTDAEIFQLEPLGGRQFAVRTSKNQLWMVDEGGVHANAKSAADNTQFEISFIGNSIALKGSNGKYLAQQMNGYLKPSADEASEDAKSLFVFEIVNRPRLALRGEYGFINTLPSGLLECNKSTAEIYSLETKDGLVAIQDSKGKYWQIGEAGISASSGTPEYYNIELFQNSKMAISKDGRYFASSQNGNFKAEGSSGDDKLCLFEY